MSTTFGHISVIPIPRVFSNTCRSNDALWKINLSKYPIAIRISDSNCGPSSAGTTHASFLFPNWTVRSLKPAL